MSAEPIGHEPFRAHVELLQLFLAHRDPIVENIQELLNAQRKPAHYRQDGAVLSRHFEDCFFALSVITAGQSSLKGQLREAHWASGFTPREMPGLHNDLIDPAQMMIRAFHFWQQTRWPGRNGRVRYAHTLFNVYLLRDLELLSMRVWDDGPSGATDRLSQVQALLDQLWKNAPADQPALVRDARWLFPLAQSPTTNELASYFEVAELVAEHLREQDRIQIQKATVQMAGGHLRSQLRHYCIKKGVSLEDNSLVLNARNSNALDFAVTIQNLVPLLQAYERTLDSGDRRGRLELAGAICQGISPDPDLFVNRLELLATYSMIEHLFITTDAEGRATYTPMGQRHVQLLQEYAGKIRALSKALTEDLPNFRPLEGSYSPYGLIYGFSSNLTEHIALKTLQPDAVTAFSLEDVFADEDAAGKLAWVSSWRKLPHIKAEVQRQFDYPQQFAADIFERIEQALRRRVSHDETDAVVRTGQLFIAAAGDTGSDSQTSTVAQLPARYIQSSDRHMVAAHQAQAYDGEQLQHDRQEGMFVVSYRTPGGWVAITKDILTEILGTGADVKIAGLPGPAAGVLKLMCPMIRLSASA